LGRSLDLELFQSIYPDFRFAFVYLDSARDLDVFSFRYRKVSAICLRRFRRYPASKSLVRISRPDIQEGVAVLTDEYLCDHAFNRRPLIDVSRRFVGRNDAGGLGVYTGNNA
jgi:hypothetical protein